MIASTIGRMIATFLAGSTAPDNDSAAYWFVYYGNRVLLREADGVLTAPLLEDSAELGLDLIRSHCIGTWDGVACFSAETRIKFAPAGYKFIPLRRTYDHVPEDLFFIAGRAFQIVDWDRTHQFCGRCAAPMDYGKGEHLKICPDCRNRCYPRISPAVIVAVTKGDRLLLGHNRNHPQGWYTVLAGFVEAGETFEETVAREIREEVGIEVKNIRYFGSQPWAFPNSVMIGFTAEWASGEFVFEDVDIETADWFSADNMPPRPHPPSIAAHLIDDFIKKNS
ncbi:MAG: NAD(+) diphosphatase [Candidatus Promineifilaceae bacterium]